MLNLNKEYELNYKRLSLEDQAIVDDSLQQATYDNHINMCSECAKKYFVLPNNIDFTKTYAVISEDFAIDNNVCAETICECGECKNEAEYTLNFMEEIE